MIIRFLAALLTICCFCGTLHAELRTLDSDGRAYRRDSPHRLVAFGDIHADYAALVSLWVDRKLVDPHTLRWIGGKTQVMMMGDLFDRYEESRHVQDFLIRMRSEAARAGGRVDTLVGNHDTVPIGGSVGKNDWVPDRDMEAYRDYQNTSYARALVKSGRFSPLQAGFLAANHGDTRYAQWNRDKDAIQIVGDTMFVHAGVDKWLLEHEPGAINTTLRGWMSALQGVGPRPPLDTSWVIGYNKPPTANAELEAQMRELGFPLAFGGIVPPQMKEKVGDKNLCDVIFGIGPLWSRVGWRQDIPEDVLKQIMEKYGVKRIVLGHTRLGQIETKYGDRVWNIDTAMGRAKFTGNDGGMLSALEFIDGVPHKVENIASQNNPAWYKLEEKYRAECRVGAL